MTSGLEGIVAAETVLSDVDGEAGRLVLRGRRLEELAGNLRFEEVAGLLWEGFTPPVPPKPGETLFGAARAAAFAEVPRLLPAARDLPPAAGLRLMLAGLPDDGGLPAHLRATGAVPVFAAALHRQALGLPPVAPDPARYHADDYLRMLHGRDVPAAQAAALDTYLVTVADHGLNASTFTARVVASTAAGTIDSVVAAYGALRGPLHGGAPGPVLDMLDAIGDAANIRPWLEARIAAGERLMGFGHRIYKVRDPRAEVLRQAVRRLDHPRVAFAESVEREAVAALERAKPGRRLQANVEFYTALLLDAVGLPRTLFTPTFAAGRMAGWTAHVLEQQAHGRLIRPQARYIGPKAA